MRTDLSVEEAGAVVDPPKRREAVLGHWCEEKGGLKPQLRLRISTLWSATRGGLPGVQNEWLVDVQTRAH